MKQSVAKVKRKDKLILLSSTALEELFRTFRLVLVSLTILLLYFKRVSKHKSLLVPASA